MNAQAKRALLWIVMGSACGIFVFSSDGLHQDRYTFAALLGEFVGLCGYVLARLLRV